MTDATHDPTHDEDERISELDDADPAEAPAVAEKIADDLTAELDAAGAPRSREAGATS